MASSQDTFIFSGTIRDNIRFGRLDATNEEIEDVAKAVGAHEFIVQMPGGYDTEVEERGNMLSMGQRHRCPARALLADPRILILDEATASIDTETELKIQEALKVASGPNLLHRGAPFVNDPSCRSYRCAGSRQDY